MKDIDDFYLQKPEPLKSCLLALREIILRYNSDITETWKYKMPVFCFKGKMFCYVWVHKKTGLPYLGIVEGGKISHPKLIQEKRSRMKIMFVETEKDLPIKTIHTIFRKAMTFYV